MMMSGTTGSASGGSAADPGPGSAPSYASTVSARLEGVARAVAAVPGMLVAAEIAAHLDRSVAFRPGGSTPVVGRLGRPIAGERLGKRLAAVRRRLLPVDLEIGPRVLAVPLAALEQRVLLDLGLDKIGK